MGEEFLILSTTFEQYSDKGKGKLQLIELKAGNVSKPNLEFNQIRRHLSFSYSWTQKCNTMLIKMKTGEGKNQGLTACDTNSEYPSPFMEIQYPTRALISKTTKPLLLKQKQRGWTREGKVGIPVRTNKINIHIDHYHNLDTVIEPAWLKRIENRSNKEENQGRRKMKSIKLKPKMLRLQVEDHEF